MSKTTTFEAFLHLLNGCIGSGVLSMPKAFGDGGLVVSSLLTPIIGLLSSYCIHMVIRVNEHVCQRLELPPQDYEQVAEYALAMGPRPLQKYAGTSKYITCLFIILSQVGACAVYYLFIAENLQTFFENIGIFEGVPLETYLAALLPILILLQCIRDIKYLALPSTLANIMQICGMAIIVYNLSTDIPALNERKLIGNKFPLFFVTTIFNFEGISIAMPLYKSMKNPKAFGKCCGVVDLVIVIIIACNFILGLLGYLKYGDGVEDSVSMSLPQEPLYASVQMMYAIAVIMTYPITMYVPIEMCWPSLKHKLMDRKLSLNVIDVCDFGFRIILVILTYLMASLIPELNLILSLVGALASSSISIIIPAILHGICFWDECKTNTRKVWLALKNSTIVLIGLAAFILGTYYSLIDLVKALGD